MKYYYCYIDTPLGTVCAVADEQAILFLNFYEDNDLYLHKIQKQLPTTLIAMKNVILDFLEDELKLYFQGSLRQFMTPVSLSFGTTFQKNTWRVVQGIEYGKKLSYQQVACVMQHDRAVRSVGQANGANNILILIPCHRVIQSNGLLGGYAAGVERKEWLLNHEKRLLS